MKATRSFSPQWFLRSGSLFAGLDDQTLAALASAGHTRQAPEGKTLFSQADSADALYVVCSGRMPFCWTVPTDASS